MMDDLADADRRQLQTFLAHLQAGRKRQANEVLRQVLSSTTPAKAGAYALLIGGMLAQNSQFREAVPLYREAIRLNPAEPAAYFYLGVAHHALHEAQECDRIWDELAARFPENALCYYQRGLRALRSDDYVTAQLQLQTAIERTEWDNPMRADALKTLSLIEQALARQSK
jgi:tetratricopeptide (TPR) repeat protein